MEFTLNLNNLRGFGVTKLGRYEPSITHNNGRLHRYILKSQPNKVEEGSKSRAHSSTGSTGAKLLSPSSFYFLDHTLSPFIYILLRPPLRQINNIFIYVGLPDRHRRLSQNPQTLDLHDYGAKKSWRA